MVRKMRFSLFIIVAFMLSSCTGNTKESLGLTRSGPDEYTVIANPPLSLPPDFKLRTPEAERDRLYEQNMLNARASELVLKNDIKSKNQIESFAESKMLEKAETFSKDSDIRKKINEDLKVYEDIEKSNSLSKYYYHYKKRKENPVVDPNEEIKKLDK